MKSCRTRSVVTVVAGLCGLVSSGRADQWDLGSGDNVTGATRNEMVHGSDQLHDLAHQATGKDEDWYQVTQQTLASYEAVVDSTSGRLGGLMDIERLDSAGAVLQTSQSIGAGFSRSLRWQSGASIATHRIRIKPSASGCNPTPNNCGPEDVYRVRFYETTYSVPRFNNTNGQTTFLIIQNPTHYTANGVVYFWNSAGTQLGTHSFGILAKQTLVLATASVVGVANQSGAITIAHDARYGDLVGKAVSLEPATGFAFDTLMAPRPR